MKLKKTILAIADAMNVKFMSQFGFFIKDTTFSKVVDYMHEPKDSSSLAITRILFGLAMLFDISDERGGAIMDQRWGDPDICHFPLFPFLRALPMPYMAIVYAGLWFGALGIMLGYEYRISAAMFSICYWYVFLIEKSFWNNHSYLFGLVAVLLACTDANCYWSIDVRRDPSKLKTMVPYWNYFILKYQFFILYFVAGLKKGTFEWLSGYSMQNLSQHWLFDPFKALLTESQIDFIVVHWCVFLFDLTVAFWMMYAKTRNVAMVLCAMFHLMNTRLFRIGMFPWVCLATMPLFYPFDWPKILIRNIGIYYTKVTAKIIKRIRRCTYENCNCKPTDEESKIIQSVEETAEDGDVFDAESCTKTKDFAPPSNKENNKNNFVCRKKVTLYLIVFHVITQAFLPYSHFITKGYNNWTNGLYGYSWDMMVYSWNNYAVIVKVVDNDKHSEIYIDPYAYTPNDRWTKHGDMVYQYAQCLKEILIKKETSGDAHTISKNISIYIDVWYSMNGRFTQRLFNPKVDLLKADWSLLKDVSYLMPLLNEALAWRTRLAGLEQRVHSWNNYSDVMIFAEFPGYQQEKYISADLSNVTLTVLEGIVAFEPQVTKARIGHSYKLADGQHIKVDTETFHKVMNIGQTPAYYMYTFNNVTEGTTPEHLAIATKPKLPILTELFNRIYKMFKFVTILFKNMAQFVHCQ